MVRIFPPAALGLLLLVLPVFTLAQDKAPAGMPPEAVQRLVPVVVPILVAFTIRAL